ncbi:MAG TPA: SRPBCC family protein [Pseudonocardia sp.]
MRRAILLLPVLAAALVGAARLGRRSGVTDAELVATLPGDDVVPAARVVIDRATTLAAPPEQVWPWIVQLGKRRAGWYFPAWAEAVMPRDRRGLRHIEPRWQRLAVGDVIPDWGGPAATFEVVQLEAPHALVYRSTRGRPDREPIELSWALVLTPVATGTRLHLRLRISALGRRAPKLVTTVAGLIDEATVAPLFVGLAERLR